MPAQIPFSSLDSGQMTTIRSYFQMREPFDQFLYANTSQEY